MPLEDIDIKQLKLLYRQALRNKTVNEKVLSLREIYDSPSVSPASLLRCPRPTITDFEIVEAFYREHRAGKRACGKVLRKMLIPYLRQCPNAYRICKSSTDYFIWDGKKFVLNIDLFMFTDKDKIHYNDTRTLMNSFQDGSFFWMGDYKPRERETDIVPRMQALAKSFDIESDRDNVEPLMLASISEEYCRYIREVKKICAELKIRLNNTQTALAAVREMREQGTPESTGIIFDVRAANKRINSAIFDQMAEFGKADAAKFNEFLDYISRTFSDTFSSVQCARYGLVDFPIADDINLTDIREPIPVSDLEQAPPKPPSISVNVQDLRCELSPNQPYDYWDDTIDILYSMIDMPGWIPEFDDVFDKNIVGEARKVISKLSLDREINRREIEEMLASTPRIPTKENTAAFRAVSSAPSEQGKRKRKSSRKASWY